MTARRDTDRLIQAFLDEGQTELSDRAYDAVRAHINETNQRVVIGPWRIPDMSNFARFAAAAAAVLVVVVVGIYLLPKLGGIGGPIATPTASPTSAPTSAPSPTPTPISVASPTPVLRTIQTRPFVPPDGFGVCVIGEPPQTGCTESPADDSIQVNYVIPVGWSSAPFNSVWLAFERSAPPGGAGVIAVRGGWLYSDPCRTDIAPPDMEVGPSVDDFANALAEHPLLDVTAPVAVTLAGYQGKYVDLQVPTDISACDAWFPWEPGLYAQGPSQRLHLWILDVEGIRVVIQSGDYAETSAEHRAELDAVVQSIQIKP